MPRAGTSVLLALAAAIVALSVASSVAASAPGTTTSSTASVLHLNRGKLFSFSGAAATGRALQPIEVATPWYGGSAPAVTSVDVTGEFLDQRTGLYHFRTKAIVRRLGEDRNGKIVLLRARTWRDAFDQLDASASSRLGLRRGSIRDTIIQTFGYTSAELRRPFPTLTADVAYEVIVSVEGREPRRSNPAGRRAKDARSFVEPLSVGIPPGTHEIGVVGCLWPDESHPMTKPFASFVRLLLGAGKLGTAAKAGQLLVAAAAGGPIAPLARVLAGALAVQLGKSFLVTAVTCGASSSRISPRTRMPHVVGQDQDDALRELRARSVRVDLDVGVVRRQNCDDFKSTVVRQSPASGALLTPGQTVFIVVRHCVQSETACDARNPWNGTWKRLEHSGSMTITQRDGRIERFTFSWLGRKGQFDRLKLSGGRLMGHDPTPGREVTFSIGLTNGGKKFEGTWSWVGRSGGGKFSAERLSCLT